MFARFVAGLTIGVLAALICVLVALILLVMDIRRELREASKGLDQAISAVTKDASSLGDVIQETKTTVGYADVAIINLNMAAQQAQAFYPRELREVAKTTAAAKDLLDHTDISLNRPQSGTIPVLTSTIRTLDGSIADLDKITVAVGPTVANLEVASTEATRILGDSSIPRSLQELADASAATARTTEDAAQSADMLKTKLQDMLKPQRLIVTLFERLLGVTAEGAQIYYAVHP